MDEDMYTTPGKSSIGNNGFEHICNYVFGEEIYKYLVGKLSYRYNGCQHDAIQEGCIALYLALGDAVTELSEDELKHAILKESSSAGDLIARANIRCGVVAGSGRLTTAQFREIVGIDIDDIFPHVDRDEVCEEERSIVIVDLVDKLGDEVKEAGISAIENKRTRAGVVSPMARRLGVDRRTVSLLLKRYRTMIRKNHAEMLEDALWEH